MPENACARFLARALLNFRANYRTNPAKSRLAGFSVYAGSHKIAVLLSRPLRHDDDCEFFPELLPFLNFTADAFVGERNFRNQNYVRAAGHTRKQSDPAGVTTHDFENHDAIMTFSSGMQPIERIGRARHGGIKSEREQRSLQIVVYGLGHADYWNSVFKKLLRDAQRAVAAN